MLLHHRLQSRWVEMLLQVPYRPCLIPLQLAQLKLVLEYDVSNQCLSERRGFISTTPADVEYRS